MSSAVERGEIPWHESDDSNADAALTAFNEAVQALQSLMEQDLTIRYLISLAIFPCSVLRGKCVCGVIHMRSS